MNSKNLGLGLHYAQHLLNLYPFMSTKRVQDKVEAKTNVLLDGRTIAGLRSTLHRQMVRRAA